MVNNRNLLLNENPRVLGGVAIRSGLNDMLVSLLLYNFLLHKTCCGDLYRVIEQNEWCFTKLLLQVTNRSVDVIGDTTFVDVSKALKDRAFTVHKDVDSWTEFEDRDAAGHRVVVYFGSESNLLSVTRLMNSSSVASLIVYISKYSGNIDELCADFVSKITPDNVELIALFSQDKNVGNCCYWSPTGTKSCRNMTHASCSNEILVERVEPRSTGKRKCKMNVAWVKTYPFTANSTDAVNPGIYISLFNTIQDASGILMRYFYDENHQREFLNKGKCYKLIEEMREGKVDVILGHLFVNDTAGVEFGPIYYNEKLVFVVRDPKELNAYRPLLKVFSRATLLVIAVLCFTICALYLTFVKLVENEEVSFVKVLVEMCRNLLGWSAVFEQFSVSARLLLSIYLIFCIIINAISTANLRSGFFKPMLTTNITNSRIMYHQKQYISVTMHALTVVYNYPHRVDEYYKKINFLNQTEYEPYNKVAAGQTNATVAFSSTLQTYPSETIVTHGIPFSWNTMFQTFYMRKGNKLNGVVKYWAQELAERGFFAKWWRDLVRRNRTFEINFEKISSSERDGFEALTLVHYEEVFFIVSIAYTASFFILLVELFWIKLENRIEEAKERVY